MKTIEIPSSKSDVHRAMIAACLAEEPCRILYSGTSSDIEATERCVREIRRARQEAGREAVLPCGESGSTLRFLLPVAGALGLQGRFLLSGRLPDRPHGPLLLALEHHGMQISKEGREGLRFGGQLLSGTFRLPGDVSSQFVSGLLFALPLLKEDSVIRVTRPVQSEHYIRMTVQVIGRFGIRVIREETPEEVLYRVLGGQRYRSPDVYPAEGDWSSAAFWLAAGVLGPEAVQVAGLRQDSLQGDREIVRLLQAFGAEIEAAGETVTAHPATGGLRGITIDAGQIPDLVPVLALVGVLAEEETRIVNAARLRMKESDRLRATAETLNALGAEVAEGPDRLEIRGVRQLMGGTVSSFGDHRIAMMAAVASLRSEKTVQLHGSEAVRKSYPEFFGVLDAQGLGYNLERD
ncbi:MAG: 3-phosphoshikimate 1-carboxyvinyltransferase [Mogibacterium sp.]|nr:3-phosphoshikimate 1-carboxyvinyltransferase [Mogibacterium sp.]